MKYLTKLEKLVALFVCVIVAVMCIQLLNALDPLEAVWIIPASVVIVLFIIVLLLGVSDARQDRVKIKDFNELRKEIVLTRFQTLDHDGELMVCHAPHKNMEEPLCRDCKHAHLHLRTTECDAFNCEHIGKVTGAWKKE